MSLKHTKAELVPLADVGFDERWLQDRILEDPSNLALGDLSVVARERRQAAGGRIDFLMRDPETSTMYEIEIMLGRLDETHIIRTIEYWDLERRRWPDREHRAVIVAEDITNRFFNVISLLNRSVPIIAVQLNALRVEDKIVLNFTKVLDVFEGPEIEDETGEPTDRTWWEKRSNPDSFSIVDECKNLLAEGGQAARITYNQSHIALGGSRRNFCWFHPRKVQSHCLIDLRTDESSVETVRNRLEEAGINVSQRRKDLIVFNITPSELDDSKSAIKHALRTAINSAGGAFG